MRKFVSFFLALAIAAGLCAPALAAEEGLANFQKVHSYTEGQFTDVAAESWCAESVRAAFEYGLMDGVGGGRFAPDGSLTLAQTVVMACRIHEIYTTGESTLNVDCPNVFLPATIAHEQAHQQGGGNQDADEHLFLFPVHGGHLENN